ncbi:DUF4856 domain-containing protein [Winogradskyella sp. F6397]|uniref:DUF4856 domain-containing protein n=1 Tax=Winogradskyella marina TaxID=2785530 RepID=A0ABS0EIU2_9FLAO|nr:DUF4856 domain-containing protein [Winogradskyella marina]MBF8150061.1 DUF4856 domain-containing protein [Winogradskyella marina]
MKKIALSLFTIAAVLMSCSSDDDNGASGPQVNTPVTYEFSRDGNSSVSFSGQTTRIAMGEEFVTALKDNAYSEAQLDAMFAHVEGADDFLDADLNASDKSLRSKVAASQDYFSANTTDANAIKTQFDAWISDQATNVFSNWDDTASAGNAGQLQQAGGGTVRYINAKGFELNQFVAKGLIGSLMTDQILNNYLSPAVLDEASNISNNDNDIVEEGKSYTTMEHKWDEAFGYLYGAEDDATMPTLDADSFLSEYMDRVEADEDFAGIAQTVYDAFKLGRAAIVAKNYTVRDAQAEIIKENISKILAVRGVYYLQRGKEVLAEGDMASAFHQLSEGFGFVYSLQFTRQPGTNSPYFSKSEVDAFMAQISEGNGFWDITPETLDAISTAIADRFDFTVAQTIN